MKTVGFVLFTLLLFASCNQKASPDSSHQKTTADSSHKKSTPESSSQKAVKAPSDKLTVIGNYSYWENSMCSQNCSVISVGNFYSLATPLPDIQMHTRDVFVLIEGKLKTVETLATVAGPKPKHSTGQKVKSLKFEVSKHKVLDFPSISIDSKNKQLAKDKADFEIGITLKNPTSEKLTLYVTIDKMETQTATLNAGDTKTIQYKITNGATVSDHTLHVYNFKNSNDDIVKNLKEIEKTGVVVKIEKRFPIESILK
ncbi:hypothetical protein KKF34_02240 [Myxococcota bacterium]|nr:hypothetical protein [Myxococcota bacterium]MBU1382230.1 hypothetical protein [Myxococcota bacterium]MBU1495681.1 hypothetical protein [Myxococcota bacterium]